MWDIEMAADNPQEEQSKDLLSSLPDELIILVGEELSVHSLNAFIQTSRQSYYVLTSNLYTSALGQNTHAFSAVNAITFAARTGNLATIRKFLTFVLPNDDRIKSAWSPAFIEATRNGLDHVVRFIIELGVPLADSLLKQCLLIAARGNYVKIVEVLIDAGVDIASPRDLEDCPLGAAAIAYQGDAATVKLLCDRGANRSAINEAEDTVLHELANIGCFDMLRFFLDLGSPIDAQNTDGDTPLCVAVRHQHHSAVLLLLSRGASVSILNNSGNTPLHLGVMSRATSAPSIVQLLLNRGADVNARSGTNKTPLHLATKDAGGDQEILKILLAAGADCRAFVDELDRTTPLLNVMLSGYYQHPNIALLMNAGAADNPAQDTRSLVTQAVRHNLLSLLTALVENSTDRGLKEYLATRPLHEAVRPGHEEILKYLLTKVDHVNWKTPLGTTPLIQAASSCASPECIRLLLEHNAHADAINTYGGTALMQAAQYSSAEVTAMILERTANPSAVGITHQTALHHAIEAANEDNVNLLLKHGLSPTQQGRRGISPITLAIRRGNPLVVQTLLSYSVDVETLDIEGNTPLATACKEGNSSMAQVLLSAGANPNNSAERGSLSYPHSRSPLCIACDYGNPALVSLLLRHGADVQATAQLGQKPLGIAATKGHTGIVSLLLTYGASASINTIVSNPRLHRTALVQAAEHGHTSTITLLLAHNASINHTDYYGRTALSHAAENGHTETIRALLSAGADIDLPDAKGQTPLFWAVHEGHQYAVMVLVQSGADVTHGNKDGQTPISVAMGSTDERLIRILYEYQ
ncbi:ankyrin repeat-containing domain protein [Aspergillus californicus]